MRNINDFKAIKILLVLFFVLATRNTSAQWNKFSFVIETGHESRSLSLVSFENNIHRARFVKYDLFYSTLEAGWTPVKFFKPEVKVQTWFRPEKINVFDPYFVRYDINFNFFIKNFEFGYRHYCFHSVDRIWLNEGSDNFFIRIKINK